MAVKARTPLYRGQGNAPFIMSDPRSAAKRGQTVPYNINGAPTGGSTTASNISVTPVGTVSSTDVQGAIAELAAEKQQVGDPVLMPEYTVAGAPNPATFDNCAIIVSNEVGGRTIATSDGTNWRRVSDGAVIS